MTNAKQDRTTGRTPWDVAAMVVSRLGPTVIVVAGFLAFTYFLYTEINRAKETADKQLQESLTKAQDQLVANTTKMGEMSATLIDNINKMLALNKEVDEEIEANRRRYEAELVAAQENLTKARTDLADAKREAERTRAETEARLAELETSRAEVDALRRQVEDELKKLEVQVADLERQREELGKELEDYAARLGALREYDAADGDQPTVADAALPEDPAARRMREILEAFAVDPGSAETLKGLRDLVGQSYQTLRAEIGKDGLGFSVWFSTREVKEARASDTLLWGYHTQERDGPRNYLRIRVSDQGVIVKIDYRRANVLSEIPKAENWYQRWMCDLVVVTEERFETFYSEEQITRWNQISLLIQRYPARSYESEILFGTMANFELVSLSDFQTRFPESYADWTRTSDAFGRPTLILGMMARAEGFDAGQLGGMTSHEFPEGLAEATIRLLNAAVADDTAALRDIAPGIPRDSLGAIAAMALRERIEVAGVRASDSVVQKGLEDPDVEVIFALETRLTRAKGPSEGRLIFSRSGSEWQLRDFVSPF